MNSDLIKKLSAGLIAVKNEGGSRDELRRILKAAFPTDRTITKAVDKYYCLYGDNEWHAEDETDLPSHSIQDFFERSEETTFWVEVIEGNYTGRKMQVRNYPPKDTYYQLVVGGGCIPKDTAKRIPAPSEGTEERWNPIPGTLGEKIEPVKNDDFLTAMEQKLKSHINHKTECDRKLKTVNVQIDTLKEVIAKYKKLHQ